MSILTQSFSHSVSSLMIGKIQGNIIDVENKVKIGNIWENFENETHEIVKVLIYYIKVQELKE